MNDSLPRRKSYLELCGIQQGYMDMLKFFVAKNEANGVQSKKTTKVDLQNGFLSSSNNSHGVKRKDKEIIRY